MLALTGARALFEPSLCTSVQCGHHENCVEPKAGENIGLSLESLVCDKVRLEVYNISLKFRKHIDIHFDCLFAGDLSRSEVD